MMRTLFLQAPSFDGFDGGAGARYQARREIQSFWYPTWLAQPAALVEGSKLIDAPPHKLKFEDVAPEAAREDRGGHQTRTSPSTKAKKLMLMTPFSVKNAASRRRVSPGETRACSYARSPATQTTPSQ